MLSKVSFKKISRGQWRWMTSYINEAQMFQGDTLVPGGRTHTIPLKENPEVCVQCSPWLRRDHESCPSLQGVLEWVRTSQLPRPPPLPPAHQPPPQGPLYSYKVNTHSLHWLKLTRSVGPYRHTNIGPPLLAILRLAGHVITHIHTL